MPNPMKGFLRIFYVVFTFCAALFVGALKGILVGPIAGLILVLGNVGVILGLFPAHVAWTVYTLIKTYRFDAGLKVVLLFALPPLFALWLGLAIAGSVLIGVGYGFFTPWVAAFEAFRQSGEWKKFVHCIVDGTWGTIKGSCTVVRDFADCCYHSYPVYLKEIRECSGSDECHTIRLKDVPACILVGLMGLIVEIPLYTFIALIKSPYMLFKGWQRLLHDLVSREGPFLEKACVPVAGLAIILWPLVVIGSILMAIFSSFFVGLYGAVVVYQERSFRRGVAYIVAMVSEFDEYTNDWLYLREGSIFPKPLYRRKRSSHSTDLVGASSVGGSKFKSSSLEAPAMLVPSLAPSRSVREAIQEVKMVQQAITNQEVKLLISWKINPSIGFHNFLMAFIGSNEVKLLTNQCITNKIGDLVLLIWEDVTRACELRGKELMDANAITLADLNEWIKAKTSSQGPIVGVGLPSYSLLQSLLNSIKTRSSGFLLTDGVEVTHLNRPQDRLIEWFFNPLMVLKDQINAIKMGEGEVRFLEKLTLYGSNTERIEAWDNGSVVPLDALRAAQIQAISRRLIGMVRGASKFPTYRRRFRHVVKTLITYHHEKEGGSVASHSNKSVASIEIV